MKEPQIIEFKPSTSVQQQTRSTIDEHLLRVGHVLAELAAAWQVKFGRQFVVEPGFQIYGEPGAFGHFAKWSNQDNRGGPQLFGKIFDIGPGTLEWNGGILIGMTKAVPVVTPRWQLEYEIHY